jgi:hypothetical protein
MPMDVDWEEELGENGPTADTEDEGVRNDIESKGEGDEPEDDEDDIGDEEDEGELEGGVLEHTMEVEDEELRSDPRGLDDHAVHDDN